MTDSTSPRSYGNWRRPIQPGIGSLGLFGTGLVFAGMIATLLVWFVLGLIAGLLSALVFVVLIAGLAVRDRHGRSGLVRIATRLGWHRTKRSGSHLYRSGPLGPAPAASNQLPGLAASSMLDEYTDAFGRPFAFLAHPTTETYAVVLRADSQGAALVDTGDVDQWVAHYGNFLTLAGRDPGLIAAAVTIETAPDNGSRLRREVSAARDPSAPSLAASVLDEIVDTYPSGSSTLRCFVTLTYSATGLAGRPRHPSEVARDAAAAMGAYTSELSAAGGGPVAPLPAADLAEAILVAYNPDLGEVVDDLHANGHDPGIGWSEVGPGAAQTGWDHYRHASAVSRSWVMSSPPRGIVESTVLAPLLQPHPSVLRKRVTVLYRPYEPGRAKDMVEADKRTADFKVSGSRPTSRDRDAQRAASQTADEEARGAGLVDFGMVVTATVAHLDDLPAATGAVESAAGQARVQLRVAYGSQDSAFAAALPIGLVIPLHLKVPSWVADAL